MSWSEISEIQYDRRSSERGEGFVRAERGSSGPRGGASSELVDFVNEEALLVAKVFVLRLSLGKKV